MKKWGRILSIAALCGTMLAGCGSTAEQPKGDAGASTTNEPAALQPEKQLVVAGNGATVEQLMKDEIFKKI